MRRFKNILAVYHDDIGADDVFAQSVALARANGAKLTLIDVVPDKFATPLGVKEREKRLRRLLPAVHAEGVADARVHVTAGTPFLEIIREVLREGHDLVVTCPDSAAVMRNFYPGSTATHLVRKCPCPVWIVKPNSGGRYKRVLACVDPDSSNQSDGELDIKILELAASLAATNGADLHVIHAWDVEGLDRDRLRSEIRDTTREDILSKHEALHRDRVRLLIDRLPAIGDDFALHLPRSSPHDAITDVVGNREIDLIVMGSVNRTGISGFFIGSAAEAVLSSVRCSMFTVKPEGFRTPVVLEPRPATAVG